ncbi:family 78 glycoside hydrolase catalytic domain, partial [Streptomyces sp. SID5785]|uniref:family 78 glycoside hydrolase catalytic domain n=1 Tax=Streptomyces sp. SID5785 TaxID=2690309 RepID=UPI002351B6B2
AAALTLAGPASTAAAADDRTPSPGRPGSAAPDGLLADLLPQGLGVGAGRDLRFSWQVPDAGAGTVQRAWQVQVTSGGGDFARTELVWDSGRVTSADSTAVAYGGPPLEPGTTYWWRVRCWSPNGSPWSRPVLLATAMEDAWTAEPVWAPAGETITDGTVSARLKITATAAGIWFRARSTSDTYLWQLRAGNPGVLRKHICQGGTYTVLEEVDLPVPVPTDTWVDLEITMDGPRFTTTVDGAVVDTTTDARLTTGNVGLRNGSTEAQVYDRFTVRAADGTLLVDDDFTTDRGTFSAGTVADGVLTLPTGASALSSYVEDDSWALLRHAYRARADHIAAAVLHVAAESPDPGRQYVAKVWSNGETVAHASARSGTGVAYQVFDITRTLRRGRDNTLAALCHTTTSQKFLAQLHITYADGSRQTVGTGPAWRARRQQGLLPPKGSAGTNFYSAPQEYWDLRHEPVDWTRPGFDDRGWEAAVTRDRVDGLVPARVEPVRLHDVRPRSVTEVAPGRWLVDLGREIVGGLRLEVHARTGDTVEVRLGEELNADGTVRYQLRGGNTYRETWTLRDGDQHVEHWGYRAFRWAELRTSIDLSRASVTGRAWKADWDDAQSSFSSSSPDLDRVWQLCRYSIEATRQDLYQDTPTRERGPYEGDALVNQLSEYAVQRSYALARWRAGPTAISCGVEPGRPSTASCASCPPGRTTWPPVTTGNWPPTTPC